MGILTRPLLRPQQRWDLEDYNTALSALRADSHFYTKNFISATSAIVQGFTISQAFIGQPTADITMDNATLVNGDNTGDFSWWTAPASPSPMTIPTGVGGLQNGRNYVELEIFAQDGTPLQRAFWDPTANSGAGTEFTQEVNTVTELFIKIDVNQSSFSSGNPNRIALAIIDLDGSSNIKGIQDKRTRLFRLGQPDNIDFAFPWGTQEEPQTTLTFTSPSGTAFVANETVTFSSGATATVTTGGNNNIQVFSFSTNNYLPGDTVTGGTSAATASLQSYYNSFSGADKDLNTYSDMFKALMNEIRAVKGTRFWYQVGTPASLPSLLNYVNLLLAPISAGARFGWSGTALKITDNKVSGQATSDVIAGIRVPGFGGNLYLTRQDGTGGSTAITIPDKSILFVKLPASGASRSWSETGPGDLNFQVVDIASFVPSDANYIIAYREGNNIVLGNGGELSPGEDEDIGSGISKETLAFIGAPSESSSSPPYTTVPSGDLSNQFTTNDSLTQAISVTTANVNDIAASLLQAYSEPLTVVSGAPSNTNEVTGPLASTSLLTLPLDSSQSEALKQYKVGSRALLVFLNGQKLDLQRGDYNEAGSPGSLSNQIQILQNLVVDDYLEFIILTPSAFGTSSADQPFFVNYIVGQNGTSIPSGAIYNTGTDRLQIWRDGLAMVKSLSLGDPIDRYQETNANSVTIAQTANPDEVFAFVNHEAPNPTVTLITGISGTTLTVPTYVIGNKALRIFRNGVLLTAGAGAPSDLGYTEATTTTVTLALAAGVSDVFKVFIAGAVPTWRETHTTLTGTNITLTNAFVNGSPKLLVFRNGLLMYKSISIGDPIDRYQESGTNVIILEVAAVSSDFFEFIYI